MAQHVDIIMDRFHNYVDLQLTTLSQSNPLMALAKPLLSRAIENNTYKLESILKQIADKDGMIDIDGILSEMTENIINTRPFKMNLKSLGELEIGDGKIKMNLPFINKALVFNHQDLIKLKDILGNEQGSLE